jgi:predicted PurR-regulated permease PerM
MIVFVLDLMPLVGHTIGISIVTLVALTQSPLKALLVFAGYIVYIQIENYIVTPKIMKRSLSVPGLVTIIAALVGATLMGLIGALLAVPMAASVLLILDEVVFPRADNS